MNPIYMPLGILFWKVWGKKVALWYTHKHVDFKLKLATFLTDKVFSASKESFRIDTPKLLVTGHGIMTDDFTFSPRVGEEEVKLVIVGRISSIKQTKKAVEILKEVLVHHRARLTIVGDVVTNEDKSYKEELFSYIEKEGLVERVVFEGAIPHDEIPKVLKNNSIMIHTSRTGSVDKVVLEALLSGVLVLTENESFKIPLLSTGMFMEGASTRAYKDKVISFVHDKEAFLKAVTAGRKWVEDNHSLKALIPKIKEVYEKLCSSR
jgi:glycosyltransferase involved in cell wall biosynthesis